LMAVVNLLLLFSIWFFFREPPNPMDSLPKNFSKGERVYYRLIRRGGWFNYPMQFFIGCAIAASETALPVIAQERFGYGTSSSSAAFAYIGVCVIVGAIFLHILNKRKFSPKMCLLTGLIYMSSAWGWALVVFTRETFKVIMFHVWLFLFFSSVVVVMNSSRGLFTLIIGNDEFKASFIASSTMMVCLGRITGCILAGTLKGYDLEKIFWIVLASMFAMASFCLAMAWNRIRIKSKNDFASLNES